MRRGKKQSIEAPPGGGFFKCPAGHQLPYKGSTGVECTAMYCGEIENATTKALAKLDAPERAEMLGAEADKIEAKEQRRSAIAQARSRARRELLKVPEGMSGAEAEEWVTRKKLELTPYAIAELEYQLLYGDDASRSKAALEVLDRTGHGKQASANLGGAVIVLAGGSVALPWAERETVDAGAKKK